MIFLSFLGLSIAAPALLAVLPSEPDLLKTTFFTNSATLVQASLPTNSRSAPHSGIPRSRRLFQQLLPKPHCLLIRRLRWDQRPLIPLVVSQPLRAGQSPMQGRVRLRRQKPTRSQQLRSFLRCHQIHRFRPPCVQVSIALRLGSQSSTLFAVDDKISALDAQTGRQLDELEDSTCPTELVIPYLRTIGNEAQAAAAACFHPRGTGVFFFR